MRHRKIRRFRHHSNGRNHRLRDNMPDQNRLGSSSFSNGRLKNNFRNYQSAEKLVEKYNDLAKEALSSGDKILSENYFQHADHFARIIQQKNLKPNESKIQQGVVSDMTQTKEVEELDNKDQELTKEKK